MFKNLKAVLILTLITLVFWVAFQIFKFASSNTIPAPTQEQIRPLDPSIDTQLLERLKTLK